MRLPRRDGPKRPTARPVSAGSRAGRRPQATRGRPSGEGAAGGVRGPRIRVPRPSRLPRFTPARAGALLGILASLGGVYGLAATSAFSYARAEIPDLRWTSRAEVEGAIGIPAGTNLFRLTVEPLEARIRELPGVAAARVSVSLPDTLVVEISERAAILVWQVGASRFLVDADGVLFAPAKLRDPGASALTVIDDSRPDALALQVGSRLAPVDLDAASRLGSLVPADIGSVADELVVTLTEGTGFVLRTVPESWVAIFGRYTPTERAPAMIPGQVRLLRSRLAGIESTVAQVILPDETVGTLILKPTPGASP